MSNDKYAIDNKWDSTTNVYTKGKKVSISKREKVRNAMKSVVRDTLLRIKNSGVSG